MNKLQRYKRNKVKHLQKYTNVILKMFPADSPSLKGIYSGYTEILFTIKITKRLPQKQYITNLDVCNID